MDAKGLAELAGDPGGIDQGTVDIQCNYPMPRLSVERLKWIVN